MKLSDRLNARVLLHLKAKRPVHHGATAIAARMTDIDRLVATMVDRFIGADRVLIAELRDGTVIVADEHDPAWADALAALDRSGRAAYASAHWVVSVLADSRTPITLISAEDPYDHHRPPPE